MAGRRRARPASGDQGAQGTGRVAAPTTGSARVVPTGEVEIRGRTRQVRAQRARRSSVGRRYAVTYDTTGPKVTLGVLWFAALVAALVVGPVGLVPFLAAVAGLAGYQAALAWQPYGSGANPWVAGGGAAIIVAGSAFGVGLMGMAILVVVSAALAAGTAQVRNHFSLLEAAGTTVQCAVAPGVAAAGLVLTLRLEIGAVVALVLLVSAYEVGDFVVGSGGSTAWEGPLSGIVAVAVVAGALAVLQVPPFGGVGVFLFAGFVGVLCPLGQLVASAVLPASAAPARALRRLDSLILLGPMWVFLVGIVLQQQAS